MINKLLFLCLLTAGVQKNKTSISHTYSLTDVLFNYSVGYLSWNFQSWNTMLI